MARTCLRWEECVVWEEGGWGPRGKRCGAFQKDRFLWEIFPEIKVLSAEIRVRKYTYNRREILVWAKPVLNFCIINKESPSRAVYATPSVARSPLTLPDVGER